jgi:hypothetical protein
MDASEEAMKRVRFIMKLAESHVLKDEGAIQAIFSQLKQAEGNSYFPHIYKQLVPANYDSVTKLASEMARKRLTAATHRYSESKR